MIKLSDRPISAKERILFSHFPHELADLRRVMEGRQIGGISNVAEKIIQAIFGNLGMGSAIINPKMEIIWLNRLFKNNFSNIDTTKKPKCYRSFYAPPRNKICGYCPTVKAFRTGKVSSAISDACSDGKVYSIIAIPIKDSKGKVAYVLEAIEDVTQHKTLERNLNKINECFLNFGADTTENIKRLITVLGGLLRSDCAVYSRLDGDFFYSVAHWNMPPDFEVRNQAQGMICYDVIRSRKKDVTVIRNLGKTSYARTDPYVKRYKLQTYIGCPIKFAGKRIGVVCMVYKNDFLPDKNDLNIISIITSAVGVEEERRNIEGALKESETKFRKLTEKSLAGVYLIQDNIFKYINPRLTQICGYRAAELVGKKGPKDFVFPEDWPMVEKNIRRRIEGKVKSVHYEFRMQRKDKKIIYAEVYGSVIDYQGRPALIGTLLDVSGRHKAIKEQERLNNELLRSNRRMRQLALRDSQTGLYNYRYLQEVIEAEFYRARRFGHPVSVLMLDIDYFKSINDVYGQKFGDLVLKQLARQLKMMMRRYDAIIRSGGEEFIIVSAGVDKNAALNMAQRLLDALALYNFGDARNRVKLKLSLAVVSCPADNINRPADFINLGNRIMSAAKQDGGNRAYSYLDIKKDGPLLSKEQEGSPDIEILKGKIEKLNKQAHESLIESVLALAKTIELKDHYTGEHVERTVRYATELAQAFNLDRQDLERIHQAAILHDLGKVGISEKILLKEGKLTKEEFNEIKCHPQIAADIIRPIHFLNDIIPLILYHHERWDGKGYPIGLKAEEIPLGARIIAIADVCQALLSDRPYRKAYPKNKVIEIIESSSGTQFDPEVCRVFLQIIKQET